MRATEEDKPLKVEIPIRQHIRLHSLKVRTDRTISDTVQEALDEYLAMIDDEQTEHVEEMIDELDPPEAS